MVHSKNPHVELNDPRRNNDRAPTLAGAPTKLSVEKYIDPETGEERHRLVSSQIKFDDSAKAICLKELADHGRIGTAARAAGVTIKTVKKHVRNDPIFAEMIEESIETYRDRLIAHHQDLVFNGTQKETYDRNGMLVSTETIYPIPLIQMELRKHDEGYRDKKEMDLTVKGGVMVAPSETKSIDDWESKFGDKGGEMIEGTLAGEDDES